MECGRRELNYDEFDWELSIIRRVYVYVYRLCLSLHCSFDNLCRSHLNFSKVIFGRHAESPKYDTCLIKKPYGTFTYDFTINVLR
jgi:hypothetical protein